MSAPVIDMALLYAAAGIPVFPCHGSKDGVHCACGDRNCVLQGKHPVIGNGFHGASTDRDRVEHWFGKHPHRLIGTSHFNVIDFDTYKPGGLEAYEQWKPRLDGGVFLTSGNGGIQVIYEGDPTLPQKKLHESIDTRIAGTGYAIMPGSAPLPPHPTDPKTKPGGEYKWREPEKALQLLRRLRPFPQEIVDQLTGTNGKSGGRERGDRDHVRGDHSNPVSRGEITHAEALLKSPELMTAVAVLDATQTPTGFEAKCPAHDGRGRTSLFLFPTDNLELGVACHKGCAGTDIYRAIKQLTTPGDDNQSQERSSLAGELGDTIDNGEAVARVIAAFERHMYLPQSEYLYAMLGAVVANFMPGDPVWLGLVDGPGGGKTEVLLPLTGIPAVRLVGTLTPAALLSGTSKKERAANAKGGLLKEIPGKDGILVVKDFGAILAMHREARSEAIQALRDIYDGHYVRNVGSDGGQTLEWHGRLGFLFGSTTAIDSHHIAMGDLGERFILHRLPQVDRRAKYLAATRQRGNEESTRAELALAVGALMEAVRGREQPEPQDGDAELLEPLPVFVAQARSAVERNGSNRELEFPHAPESPTRIGKALNKLLLGLDWLGVSRDISVPVVAKTGLDSMQPRRLQVAAHLLQHGRCKTSRVALDCGLPSSTCRLALEDLAAHHVVTRDKSDATGEKRDDWWTLDEAEAERLARCLDLLKKPSTKCRKG